MDRIRPGVEIGMRQAVIDIGTNTCLLLIAESDRAGTMKVIADVHAIARLGAGVDKTKRIQSESYERLRKILLNYRTILSEKKMDAVAAVATSAMRDAENRYDITRRVKEECGFDIELLTGEAESIWSYHGSICGLRVEELQGRVAALDIGGGSTELSIGENGKFISGKSINIGAVRIKERFLSTTDNASVKSAREFIASELTSGFGDTNTHKLIAVAGTPTALAAMKLRLQTFEAEKVNGVILSQIELSAIVEELLSSSPQELVKKYPSIHPDRADILPSGALILEEILKYLKLNEVRVSAFGLRYGIMIREFERKMKAKSDEWIITRE
jgi:exopolyphosphatase/guanosine-5'-triphosphate,3'-diphosphate pyrophosphatase